MTSLMAKNRCHEMKRRLLMLGAGLLVSGTERIGGQLLALDVPDVVYSLVGESLWDSSAWLSDSHGLGGFLASFVGYRATPSGMTLLVWVGYWLVVSAWLRQRAAEKVPCLT